MKIVLLRFGKGKNKWANAACQDFIQRFDKRLPFTEHCLKPAPAHLSLEQRRRHESLRACSHLHPGDRVIALDERGQLWSTEDFHKEIVNTMNQSIKRIVFVIGGPFGHSSELRARADVTLALSKMVLNHEIARICLAEQLYRVSTLIWGGDYHH